MFGNILFPESFWKTSFLSVFPYILILLHCKPSFSSVFLRILQAGEEKMELRSRRYRRLIHCMDFAQNHLLNINPQKSVFGAGWVVS